MPFLNKKRLLAYPFLLLIALWLVTLLNLLLADGWYGRFGGFISYDFLSFYGGGKLYWTDISNLYNLNALANLQSQLVGIPESGMNYFPFPPFVGLAYGLFSFMPYLSSFLLWTALSVGCLVASALIMFRYLLPADLKKSGITLAYLLALLFSFYPTLFGLQNGQNHAHSLLLITLMTVFTLQKRQGWAGMCAALLLYKPQILVGWLLLWLLIKYYKALLAFILAGAAWAGLAFLHIGISPYLAYLQFIPQNASVYTLGHVWDVTPIAILSRLTIGLTGITGLTSIYSLLAFSGLAIGMVFLVLKFPENRGTLPLMLALLFPFLGNPHFMFYDLVLLFPLFILWSQLSRSRLVLYSAIGLYFSALILPIFSEAVDFPVMGVLPVFLLVALWLDLRDKPAVLDGRSNGRPIA